MTPQPDRMKYPTPSETSEIVSAVTRGLFLLSFYPEHMTDADIGAVRRAVRDWEGQRRMYEADASAARLKAISDRLAK